MKINWKVRFKNPVFLFQLLLAFFAPVLGYFGLTVQDMTTWQGVWDLLADAFRNPYVLGLVGVSLWNAINDPTTKGVSDSPSAQQYSEPK